MSNDKFTPIEHITISPEQLSKFNSAIQHQTQMANIIAAEMPKIQTPEERYKFMTDRMDKMQGELETQTTELQRLQYENQKLNAQITTQNKIIDKQLSELKDQKSINHDLQQINNTLEKNNKHSFRNGILIGLIPSAIILVATVILTYYGWL